MEDKTLTKEQSLEVINGMIAQARNRIQKGDGKYFLLWGYVIALASLGHFIWLKMSPMEAATKAGNLWIVALVIGVVGTALFIFRDSKKTVVRTYTDLVGSAVWIGFGVGAFLISFLLSGKYGAFIYPAISFLYTYALFMTLRVYKYKWMWWCVAICFVLVLLYKFVPMLYFPLLMAAFMIVGNIIPGHIINIKGSKNV